jgi:hypothetical protein
VAAQFISENTEIGARHLYGFSPALHLQWMTFCPLMMSQKKLDKKISASEGRARPGRIRDGVLYCNCVCV